MVSVSFLYDNMCRNNNKWCGLFLSTTVQTIDTYMTAFYINVYVLMFNLYITALVWFDGCVRAATLIADRLRIDYG